MRHRLVAAALALTLTTLLSAGPVRAQAQQDAALAALIDDLVAANHILYHQGIVDGYGHVSVRHPTRPDHFLMSRARAPGLVTRDDVMEFDSEANPVDRGGRPIYSERFIHSEVYKARADVKAVVHSHSPTVVPFSVTQVTLRPVIAVASFLSPAVPVFEIRSSSGITNLLVSDAARGKALAETLAQHPVALMRGHGDVVVGPDLRRTVARAIYTEVNARLQLQAVTLGGPINFIAPEEAALMEKGRDAAEQGHGANRTWEMWKEEANRRGSPPAR
jgi:ribulose-5-phosphate 4-epimerase/fuculose-1-phosphate aldolase